MLLAPFAQGARHAPHKQAWLYTFLWRKLYKFEYKKGLPLRADFWYCVTTKHPGLSTHA
jgi:hypothetical protein